MTVSRTLPTPRLVDGSIQPDLERRSGYGEQYVLPFGPRVASDEASYHVLRSTTPGTGIAGHAAPTTLDNTKPFVFLRAGALRAYLDYVKLVVTAAGTAGTLNYATHILDDGAGFTSGGEDLVQVNPNGEGGNISGLAIFKAGAVVATAGGSQRIVAHQRARTVIPVVGDVLLFAFGGDPRPVSGMALEGTTELERIIHCPPIILAPSQWYKLVLWRASQSAAASYEVEIGLWER